MSGSIDYVRRHGFGSTVRVGLKFLAHALLDGLSRNWPLSAYRPPSDVPAFQEVQSYATDPTDINDHLPRIFLGSVLVEPDTIVELGVRGGESTFAFERVCRLTDADLVSVDVEAVDFDLDYEGWHFVQADDLAFADRFEEWCSDHAVEDDIDVLFVDTSHRYDHTVAEIERWFPHLADRAVVLFHDTNLTQFYRRADHSVGLGWDNDRGIIGALEDHFECEFDESNRFETARSGFVVRHYPRCNGFTVLQKVPSLRRESEETGGEPAE